MGLGGPEGDVRRVTGYDIYTRIYNVQHVVIHVVSVIFIRTRLKKLKRPVIIGGDLSYLESYYTTLALVGYYSNYDGRV